MSIFLLQDFGRREECAGDFVRCMGDFGACAGDFVRSMGGFAACLGDFVPWVGDFVRSMGGIGMVGVILLDWINVTILL